jgi:hypothetical protein
MRRLMNNGLTRRRAKIFTSAHILSRLLSENPYEGIQFFDSFLKLVKRRGFRPVFPVSPSVAIATGTGATGRGRKACGIDGKVPPAPKQVAEKIPFVYRKICVFIAL